MLEIGRVATYTRKINELDIQNYAVLSGDRNPIHTDSEYANESMYGKKLAHGMLSAGFISAVIGTKLPGPGTIYIHQDLDFKKPVFCGDEITAIVEVINIINKDKGIYELSTKCVNQYSEVVIDGSAIVKYVESKEINGVGKEVTHTCTFYSNDELMRIGIKKYGENVLISRNAILYSPELLEIGNNVRIDDFCVISGRVKLGNYIHIAQFCGLYGGNAGIEMSDYSGLSSKVTIYATSNDYSGDSMTNPMIPQKYKLGDKEEKVYLGKHVIVGVNSVILPGVQIGDGAAIGALTMCGKSVEPWGIYVGSPARKVKDRSKKLLDLEKEFRDSGFTQ